MEYFQDLINKINAKQDFTYNLMQDDARYVVSYKKAIYKGVNPSLFDNLRTILRTEINLKNCSSIGGWLNKKTNIYYLNRNLHFSDINTALMFARQNNQLAIFDKKENLLIYLNNQ
tara:strand:+ start:338 stop:685 length:348 start_codon:yes stop_codon:yes gene_type:complete